MHGVEKVLAYAIADSPWTIRASDHTENDRCFSPLAVASVVST